VTRERSQGMSPQHFMLLWNRVYYNIRTVPRIYWTACRVRKITLSHGIPRYIRPVKKKKKQQQPLKKLGHFI